jgi:hypothetical protein
VTTDALPGTDAVVANIALHVVEAVASRVDAVSLICSGYLQEAVPHLAKWERVERRVLDGWAADRYARSA